VLGTSTERKENPALKFLVAGGAALAFEATIGHPCEFLKVLKQTNPGKTYPQLFQGVTKSKGIVGIWDGFVPWGAIQAVAKGSVFGLGHALASNQLRPLVERGALSKDAADVLAGGIGGGIQGFALSPTLLLKTRVMTSPAFREAMPPLETVRQSMTVGMRVIREEGPAALMKGSGVMAGKRVADWSTRFYFCVLAENLLFRRGAEDPARPLARREQLVAGLVGGVASTVLTLPLDVAVAQIQQAAKAGQKVPLVQLFAEQWAAGGAAQLCGMATRGLVARCVHVALTTALMKTATSMLYDALVDAGSSPRRWEARVAWKGASAAPQPEPLTLDGPAGGEAEEDRASPGAPHHHARTAAAVAGAAGAAQKSASSAAAAAAGRLGGSGGASPARASSTTVLAVRQQQQQAAGAGSSSVVRQDGAEEADFESRLTERRRKLTGDLNKRVGGW